MQPLTDEKYNWAIQRLKDFNSHKRPKAKEIAHIKMEPEYLARFYEDPVDRLIELNK